MTLDGAQLADDGEGRAATALALDPATSAWSCPEPVAIGDCRAMIWGDAGRHGVVVVGPRGVEDLATRASLAALARAVAQAGIPVLRLDLPGQGDSLGDAAAGDELPPAITAIATAVATLRRCRGAESVTVVGLRLGATLAALATATIDIDGLALLAPIVRGRGHVRELRALAPPETPMVVAGFDIAPATLDRIAAIDLLTLPAPSIRRAFIAVPAPTQGVDRLAAQWRDAGLDITETAYPDLAAHIGNPTMSRAPTDLFAALNDWLAPMAAPQPSFIPPPEPNRLAGADFAEEGTIIAGAAPLVAIVTRPLRPLAAAPTAVIVNAGRNPRIGWARGSVTLARRLAAAGIASIRVDLPGFGDSPPAADAPPEPLYHPSNIPHLNRAIAALAGLGLDRRCVLIGACSGGHLAFHAALSAPDVAGLVLVNVQRFIWRDGMSLEAAMRSGGRSTAAYFDRLRQWRTWQRLVRGDIDIGFVAGSLMRRLHRRAGDALTSLADLTGRHAGEDRPVLRGFQLLSRRGLRQLVVYSQEDGGRDDFAAHVGRDGRGFARLPATRLVILPDTDHDLTPPAARARLADEVIALCRTIAAA
ncbi:MAG: alpha/beta fold hydrolase [Hyphomicrobiaceae bacterium]|nr:alpha/beta fold hydrolase [Hyphomicrobiaceae bacterium]